MTFTLDGGPGTTARLRAALERIGAEHGLAASERFDLQVAATEALANAITHGGNWRDPIEVEVTSRDRAIEVVITDRGRFHAEASPDSERSRGIPLMVALVDEVVFSATTEGTSVRVRKRLP